MHEITNGWSFRFVYQQLISTVSLSRKTIIRPDKYRIYIRRIKGFVPLSLSSVSIVYASKHRKEDKL